MAYKNWYSAKSYKPRKRRHKSRYGELEKMAYKMGQVKRGLSNPDSLISESYNKGVEKKASKPKKTLF